MKIMGGAAAACAMLAAGAVAAAEPTPEERAAFVEGESWPSSSIGRVGVAWDDDRRVQCAGALVARASC